MTVLGPCGLRNMIQAASLYLGEICNFRIIEFSKKDAENI